jgi:hemin uptake protein HemP
MKPINTAQKNKLKTALPNASSPPIYRVEQLFDGERQVRLVHKGQEYRLSITKADKLILTK